MRLRHNGVWQAPSQYVRYARHSPLLSFSNIPSAEQVTNASNKTEPFVEPSTPTYLPNTRGYVDPTYVFDQADSIRVSSSNTSVLAFGQVLTEHEFLVRPRQHGHRRQHRGSRRRGR